MTEENVEKSSCKHQQKRTTNFKELNRLAEAEPKLKAVMKDIFSMNIINRVLIMIDFDDGSSYNLCADRSMFDAD